MSSASVACAIPARYGSTRLPGKPLLPLLGKPMIQHVWERLQGLEVLSRVVVLTDDERVYSAVEAFGGEAQMTPVECASGTDRIATAAAQWPENVVINVQGDEPLIDPNTVERLARHLMEHPEDPMATVATPLEEHQHADPARVKVVLDQRGYALYFSRAPIPFRQPQPPPPAGAATAAPPSSAGTARERTATQPLLHLGIYGYQRSALLELARRQRTPLERCESLEQLRALESGLSIRVLLTDHVAIGVDTPDDVARVEELLRKSA